MRSVLGRTCPPPLRPTAAGLPDAAAGAARPRVRPLHPELRHPGAPPPTGRWSCWPTLRLSLARLRERGFAELVFFQHDEVVVEVEAPLAGAAIEAVRSAGATATRLVLGDTGVDVPLEARAVTSYADR